MELMLKNEMYIFVGTFLGGVFLGMFSDILGLSSGKKAGNVVFLGIRDIFFCLCMATFSFIIIYMLNNGELRWYEITGIIMGVVLYTITIKKYVISATEYVKKLLKKFIFLIITPIIKIFKLFKVPYNKVKIIIKKVFKTVKYKQILKIKQIKYIFKKIWLYFF